MRALGVDYGDRRIGLARSDATGLLASPWKTIPNTGDLRDAAARIVHEAETLAADGGLDAIVVGLPRHLSGDPNDQTGRVRKLCDLLKDVTTVPITLQDERLTSREADELLARREKNWRKRKPQLDAMSAALILQDFLDGRSRP